MVFSTGRHNWQPKRVLFARAADAGNVNSQAKNVQAILRRWRTPDVRPSVFAFYEPDKDVAANPNVDLIRIAPDRLWRAKVFASYMKRFDAVFCPGLHHYADWAALKVRSATGRPLRTVMTIEGLLGSDDDANTDAGYALVAGHPIYSQKIPAAQWRRTEALLQMAEQIIAISPFLARQADAKYRAKVSVLPLGVDLALFRRDRWQRAYRPRVVCAANVRSHKRPEVFFQLAARFPQADFVWYGEGELREPLRRDAQSRGLTNIDFPGPLPPNELGSRFAEADIMLLPSRGEGVPKITQEAAAAGLAQVVFGFYEAPTVIDGVNGFVVWNDEEMAVRLEALLADPNLVERMGRAGAEMAREWSWDRVASQWEAAIVDAVNGAGPCDVGSKVRQSTLSTAMDTTGSGVRASR